MFVQDKVSKVLDMKAIRLIFNALPEKETKSKTFSVKALRNQIFVMFYLSESVELALVACSKQCYLNQHGLFN